MCLVNLPIKRMVAVFAKSKGTDSKLYRGNIRRGYFSRPRR